MKPWSASEKCLLWYGSLKITQFCLMREGWQTFMKENMPQNVKSPVKELWVYLCFYCVSSLKPQTRTFNIYTVTHMLSGFMEKKKSLSYCVWLASFCFLIMCSQFPRVMNKYGWNILIVGVGVFFKWSLWYSLAQTKGKKNWHYLTMPYSRKLCTIFFITH